MNDNWKFQASVKFGRRDDMINVRGENYDEFQAALADATSSSEAMRILSDALNESDTSGDPGAATQGPTTTPTQSTGGGNAPVCAHGLPRIYKTGTSTKNGKDWRAWMCAASKNGPVPQCSAEWL